MHSPPLEQIDGLGHLGMAALRGAIWAIIGVIFGFIFVALAESLRNVVPTPLHQILASVGSAALTALFYSSMRLTVMVANFTFIAMLAYMWGNVDSVLESLVLIGAVVGLIVGALYGWQEKRSQICCADAKILAGLLAGVAASLFALILNLLFEELVYPNSAMAIAPMAILVYVTSAPWFVRRCQLIVPAVVDGAIVGLGVGGTTGFLFMLMAGSLDPHMLSVAHHLSLVERVQAVWLPIALGTAASCGAVGVMRSLLRVRWYDL